MYKRQDQVYPEKEKAKNLGTGIDKLKENVDTIIVIPNDKLLEVVDRRTTMPEALKKADEVLQQGIQGITDLINVPSLINLDFADVKTVMESGGMAHMGIGYGLSEQLLFDEKTGRPLNNNLLDYKLSTIMDHPHLEAQFVENAEPTSAFGTKALGEPPACSGAPAIRNAIYNATGVAIDQDPITPHVLFRRFTEEGLIRD